MIAAELKSIAKQIDLNHVDNTALRIAFGIACVIRVETSLTDARVITALQIGKRYPHDAGHIELQQAANAAAAALDGRALDAAGYASYASVYAYSSSSVTDVLSYRDKHKWQVDKLKTMADEYADRAG